MKFNLLFKAIILFTIFGCNKKNERVLSDLPVENKTISDSVQLIAQHKITSSDVNYSTNYSTEQLDNTNGLSNSSVNTIFQDSESLLWIGTWDGLNRYDGSSFKIFRPELSNENSLTNQVILKINEDRSGFIWVLTIHGLNRFDKKSNTFKRFYFSRKDNPPFTESEFNMALDASKQVYCAVKDWGVGYFDEKDFKLLNTGNLPKNAVKKMVFTSEGQLLVLLDNGELYSLTIKTISKQDKSVSSVDKISDFVKDFETFSSNKICFITNSGNGILYSMDKKSQKPIEKENIQSIISKTKEGVLLSHNSGYFIVDDSGLIKDNPWLKKLKKQKITTLLQGTENIIWTGTDGDGMFKSYPQKKFSI